MCCGWQASRDPAGACTDRRRYLQEARATPALHDYRLHMLHALIMSVASSTRLMAHGALGGFGVARPTSVEIRNSLGHDRRMNAVQTRL